MTESKHSSDGKLTSKADELVEEIPTLKTFSRMLKYTGGYRFLVIQVVVLALTYFLN